MLEAQEHPASVQRRHSVAKAQPAQARAEIGALVFQVFRGRPVVVWTRGMQAGREQPTVTGHWDTRRVVPALPSVRMDTAGQRWVSQVAPGGTALLSDREALKAAEMGRTGLEAK